MKKIALLVIVVMVGFGVIGCLTPGDSKTFYDAEGYFKLGYAHAEADRWEEAIEAYKQAINLKPDYADAHYNLGVAYGKIGRWQEGVDAFKQAIKLAPQAAVAHYSLGLAYLGIGDKGSALKEYKILITLDPNRANKLLNLINQY